MNKYYLENGICVEKLPENYFGFYILENTEADSAGLKYFYPNDEIFYRLDEICVRLYDKFQEGIFATDDYYELIDMLPDGIMRAGLDSDNSLSKELYNKYFSERLYKGILEESESILKLECRKYNYAYVYDCQSMVNTLQELILGTQSNFIGFYKLLCTMEGRNDFCDDYYVLNSDGRMIFGMLYSLIISLYSTFDILTKIVYELEHLQSSKNSYIRTKSQKNLYGQKNKISINNVEGTVFKKTRSINIIENLRNELVHNATWEMNPKVFFKHNAGKIVERCIYIPDFDNEGHLVKFINRKRFFSQGKKVNEELPALYFEILDKIRYTIEVILSREYAVNT